MVLTGGKSDGGGVTNGSDNGNGLAASGNGTAAAAAVSVDPGIRDEMDQRLDQIREARMKGYEGDACGECGNFTLLRNGTCMKCDTCGGTSGCS
jgi:ribonucleoside-diphosphate reductase alpha chain